MADEHGHEHHDTAPAPQTAEERASRGGDVASQALSEALRVSFRLLKVAMVLVAILFFGSGLFIVKEEERAFVLRFGRLVRDGEGQALLGPGLHFAWPFLVDEVVRFPVQRKLSLTVKDFWYEEPTQAQRQPPPPRIRATRAGYALTGDANILHSIWSIEYQIDDPVKFFRQLGDPSAVVQAPEADTGAAETVDSLLRTLLNSAVIRTQATFRVDDALGGRRSALEKGVLDLLRRDLDRLDLGIVITKFTLDKLAVPLQTQAAFDEVNTAVYQSQTQRDEARAYARSLVTRATSQANRLISEAKTYSTRVEKQAEADADYMRQLLDAASDPQNPVPLEVFLEQRLTEVLQDVLLAADEIFVVHPGDPEGGTEIRLHIPRDPQAVRENIRRRREQRKQAREQAQGTAPTETAP
jgi:membrane protease subunit HflK